MNWLRKLGKSLSGGKPSGLERPYLDQTGPGDVLSDHRHALRDSVKLNGGIEVKSIDPSASAVIFSENADQGYHDYGTLWWTNQRCPYAYKYLDLDSLCPATYFAPGGGHPSRKVSGKLFNYMRAQYRGLFGADFGSVIELGTGGGEITRHFEEAGLDYLAVEGTEAGVARLRETGIPAEQILHRNLKFMPAQDRRFDLAMCTEVAEHIEPWFASKIVENCIAHADAVWFSAAKGDNRPRYHHINEAPISAWDNIFAHMGHCHFVELDGMASRADRIYLNQRAMERAAGRA